MKMNIEAEWSDDRQGTLPDDELTRLLSAVRGGEPWRAALDRLPLPRLSKKRYWFMDERKAAFYRSLRPAARALAIDIGPGSGVISAALAQDYRRVVAVERHPLWSRFVNERFGQDGLAGGRALRGDALALPVRAASADLVVLNGVLEWVPEGASAAISPRAVQLDCLREIRRAIKPGGLVGIAIENRWAVANFLGGSPHGEAPFAAVLPRPLAGLVNRRRLGRPYRTWIHGAGAYRRLLRRAGFDRIEIHAAIPTYHMPEAAVALGDSERLRPLFSRSRGKRAVFDILGRLGLLGRFVHSFYISGHVHS